MDLLCSHTLSHTITPLTSSPYSGRGTHRRFLPGVEEVVKEGNEMIADTGLICRVINLQDGAPEHLYLAFDDYDSFPREGKEGGLVAVFL